ncbi:MAG: hypothetical protein IKO85_08265 [Bacteroidaceae bacterium]|nr:hypothetical protein [Bacteroidaceae bacterium]
MNMIIDSNDSNWRLGELVCLKWNDEQIKKSGQKSYAYCAVSSYICVREATDRQYGILVKVLGKISKEHIMFVNGEPFCKDEREDLLKGKCYYSFPFPTLNALKEVLEIVNSNEALKGRFEAESMKFNPASTFWVREAAGGFLSKKPQYYDASSGQVCKATAGTAHYRLSIAYFNKNK